MKVRGEGPIPSRLMIVAEAPGEHEERAGLPFQGASGQELNRMLQEVGIMRSEAYVTNVLKIRPPNNQLSAFIASTKKEAMEKRFTLLKDKFVTKEVVDGYNELQVEIDMVQPNLIIAMGNLALWALTGNWGILKWRGSLLTFQHPEKKGTAGADWGNGCKVIPTIHPASILREWSMRPVVLNDLRRAARHLTSRTYDNRPAWTFRVRPSFFEVCSVLDELLRRADSFSDPLWLDLDIETRGRGDVFIDCIGLSWTRTEAICIPFLARGNKEGYFPEEEEAYIIYLLYRVLTHPAVAIRWQNGLFDAQIIHFNWHFIPNGGQDTMIAQHSVFCSLPKSLAFLASMYAEHYEFWKDEGKVGEGNEERRWTYNCKDLIYTREVGEVLTTVVKEMGLAEVDATQQALFWPVLKAMLRGVRILPGARSKMAEEVQEELSKREAFLYTILGHHINPRSPKQMQTLFYDDLKQPIVYKRVMKDGRPKMVPTVDDEALTKIGNKEPLLRPLCNAIADIRTLTKFHDDFILMPTDSDGRMRCSFNIAGDAGDKDADKTAVKSAPYTYRLSSSKTPFGTGGNLQTIPSEKSKSAGKAKARGSSSGFTLPNLRQMYGPDQGFTFYDLDLDRADLHPVAWEADDLMLKTALKMGVDTHLLNVYVLDNKEPPPLEELIETHPKYPDHRGPRKHKREFSKVFCHASDYLGKSKTIAEHTGRSIHEIDRAQKVYFGRYVGIEKWQNRVIDQVRKHRFVENKFGYRWYIFDRIDDQLMPKAVAWIPQSTAGVVINKIWLNFHKHIPEVQTLLQVHDSLAGQFPTHRKETVLPLMKKHSEIIVPYDDPLIIPTGIALSEVSWGDCE